MYTNTCVCVCCIVMWAMTSFIHIRLWKKPKWKVFTRKRIVRQWPFQQIKMHDKKSLFTKLLYQLEWLSLFCVVVGGDCCSRSYAVILWQISYLNNDYYSVWDSREIEKWTLIHLFICTSMFIVSTHSSVHLMRSFPIQSNII